MARRKKQKAKAKTFFSGFKDFITKGNVVDLAVGVIIGGAFGKIVTSLVNDIIMPPIGLLIGGVDFKDLMWVLKAEVVNSAGEITQPLVAIRYGSFIMIILEFLIIAFTIYAVLTLIIRRRAFLDKIEAEEKAKLEAEKEALKEKEPEVVVVPEDIQLLREIRDALSANKEKSK
ncbi:MAG TPA: large conductance mechanosensitive channel protein MscL [Acholeplasma sp.]|nr:large conductance mechanosensitive channel protein MscL [Acholeplasma sp.]